MKLKHIIFPLTAATLALSLNSCMDEVKPVSYLTPQQIAGASNAEDALLGGIVAFVIDRNTWGSSDYYLNDWGYPCQMFFRDVTTADIPIATTAAYNYWSSVESGTDLRYPSYYTYNYYYHFIKSCNNLIGVINPETAQESSLHHLGCALTFRALCYLDLARLFEYQNTGISALDSKAETAKGLTVSIVTEKSTEEELRNNPRLPFYTMYRFILKDLNAAAKDLEGYKPANGNYPSQQVAYGLLARFWLELGTRFDKTPADLQTQLAHENDADGFSALGITSANDCFKKASEYARLAEKGYTPMTQEEWTNPQTGFNTATNAWMLYTSISTKEQEGQFFCSLMGTVNSESSWAMPQYGQSYREIGSALYDKIGEKDWRKLSWIAPEDAGKAPAEKYRAAADAKTFAMFPAYTNLKYRSRNISDLVEGMKCDMPMMRVEEMYFIDAEATAHTEGVAAGAKILENFMNSYRYTDGSYKCTASDISSFTKELMVQKRIEFWGEGIVYFDFKRLKMPVVRTENSNYAELFQHDSNAGYVSPAMNYYIPEYAKNQNQALVMNPDCTGWYNLK